jgi:hypothetical protein
MTKPMIRVTKHHDGGHLRRTSNDVLCIDALTLTEDFEKAYKERLRPKMNGDFRANMELRFHELYKAYWQEREAKKHELAKVPRARGNAVVLEVQNASTSSGTRINSITLNNPYNTTTTDFGDPDRD